MVGFWIFLVVLVICLTIIACVFMENAEYLHLKDIRNAYRDLYDKLVSIEELIKAKEKRDER